MNGGKSNAPDLELVVLDAFAGRGNTVRDLREGSLVLLEDPTDGERDTLGSRACVLLTAGSLAGDARENSAAANEIMDAVWRLSFDGTALGDQLVYRDVPIPPVAHAQLVLPLVDALGRIAALDALIGVHGPSLIRVARDPGPWGRAAMGVAGAHGLGVRRIRGAPPRVPLRPFSRRVFTQWLPPAFRRWREAREAHADLHRLSRRAPYAIEEQQADVLAMAHYVAEAKALLPVVGRISQSGRSTAVIGDTWGAAPAALDSSGIGWTPLQDVDPWAGIRCNVESEARRLGAIWKAALNSSEATLITYRGVPIVPVLRSEWLTFAELSLRYDTMRQYLLWIDFIDRALAIWNPRVVLLADESMGVNVVLRTLARKRGARTLHVQHGAFTEHAKDRPTELDICTVGGEATRRALIEIGSDPERVVATGLPQFDPLADADALREFPIRTSFGLPDDKPLVVYTMLSGQGVASREDVVAAIREALRAAETLRDTCSFLFKRHPADRDDLLRSMGVDPDSAGISVTLDAPLHPILAAADVVVTQMSVTGIEALMLGKPLIIVSSPGSFDTIPYAEYGAALKVSGEGDLAPAILRVMQDENTREHLAAGRDRFVLDYAFKNDGHATERIVEQVYRLLDPC